MGLYIPHLGNIGRATSLSCPMYVHAPHPPSDSKYRRLFDLAGLGSATIVEGERGGMGYLSSCSLGLARLLGRSLDDMVGAALDTLAHEEDRADLRVSPHHQGMHCTVPFF